MSYILEALKKSETERERGAIPDIHARPALVVSVDREANLRATIWGFIIVVVFASLVAALAWRLSRDDSRSNTRPVVVPPRSKPQTAAPNEVRASGIDVALAAIPSPVQGARAVSGSGFQHESSSDSRNLAHGAQPVTTQKASGATSAQKSKDGGRVFALSELPAAIQRELPKLMIGGLVYSRDAANRMLMVNGQLIREGEAPAPDLMLESVERKSAVFKYKAYSYRLEYPPV